ncbi:MAG: AbiA family abortive infection protein [Cyanobacteria bacterium]|jgi:AbiA family abortive infection protein|nr:AbiA family abortive infection protein [Cyanobacteria bacterium GSL.Bin1]
MNKKSQTQLGYFIDYNLWKDALDLLNFQIQQKKKNRHFNTLSMFYYESLDLTCLKYDPEQYFNIKISTSLFYGLQNEFSVFSYVIPKAGIGLRDYKFFTYPMRVLYYTIGLYLLKLSQEFLDETYGKLSTIEAFYGGNLSYKKEELQLKSFNIYYRTFHQKFKEKIKEEVRSDYKNKVILRLDIENYFNEVSISRLLNLLNSFIKPSIQTEKNFDLFTKQQIICLFNFISDGKLGIPQSDNNIVSSFIGYLYLVFGDLLIDDLFKNSYKSTIDKYKIIRYTDDIYISIKFKDNIEQYNQGLFIHAISSQIAEELYSKLGLKLNLKSKLYRLSSHEEKEELLKNIRKSSPNDQYFSAVQDYDTQQQIVESNTKNPQDKLDDIFKELINIKGSRIEDYFVGGKSVQEEILQEVFDKNVENILEKSDNKKRIKDIFENFNFELVKVQPLEILIVLLRDENTANNFKKFCLNKSVITTGDADLIIKFLCQNHFDIPELRDKLKENSHMRNIIEVFDNKKVNCDQPGYYQLGCMQINNLSKNSDVIEQTRLRVLEEKNNSYSVALNHLVNEIHAICKAWDQENKKDYDINSLVSFLQSKGIKHETCVKIRNLFDRRNSNQVSHPSSNGGLAWEVTKEEYQDYYKHVGLCLDVLLQEQELESCNLRS